MTHRSRSVLRFSHKLLAFAVPAAVLLSTKAASAQQWLRDPRVGAGQGLQAGDLELHPGVGGEVGYDSNFFLRTSNRGRPGAVLVNGGNDGGASDNPPREAVIARVTPSFSVNTRNREPGTEVSPFFFSAGAALTYMEFFGVDEIRKQRNAAGGANVRMDVNRGRPVGFDVYAGYTRFIQPNTVADPNLAFNRSDVNAGGDVVFMPGGGTLDLRTGYQFYGALFEESAGVPFSSMTHEVSFRDRWKFRPRTALFHDTSLRFQSYPNASRAAQYLNDSTPLRTRFGLTGLITDRFGALAAIGYGATFFQNPQLVTTPQYDSVTGQAEITWHLSANPGADQPGQVTLLLSTINLGYVRDFQNSLIGNFYTSNKGYLRFNYFFGSKAVIQLGGDVEDQEYEQPYLNINGNPTPAPGVGPFANIRVGGLLFGEYRLIDTLGLNATINYDQVISDTRLPASAAAGNTDFFDLSWKRLRAFLGLRWFL